MTCHNGRFGPEHDGDCYRWSKVVVGGGYKNKTTKYMVILGQQFPGDGLAITDVGGDIIDNVTYTITNLFTHGATPTDVAGTFDGSIYSKQEIKKTLLPPGATASGPTNLSVVICGTLDHALDIL